MPLAPIGTSSTQKIPYLKAGDSGVFEYKILPYADAESRIYKVPAVLSYYDETGTKMQKNDVIAIIVGAEPDLQVTIDKTAVYKKGQTGDITFRISNKGVSDIKFMTAKIMDDTVLKVIGPNSVYIGGVDSDDFELVTFKINVKQGKDVVKIPILLEYKDANNDEYTEKIYVNLPLYSSREVRKYGLVKGTLWSTVIVLFIIIGAGYWYWKKRKAKKKK